MNNTNESKYLGQFPNADKVKIFYPKATPEGQLQKIDDVLKNKIWQTDISYSTLMDQFNGNPVGNFMLIMPDRAAQRLGHVKGVIGRIARIVPISGQNPDLENQINNLRQEKNRIERANTSMRTNPNNDPEYRSILSDLEDLERMQDTQPHTFPDQNPDLNIIPSVKIIFSTVKEIPNINNLPVSLDLRRGTRKGFQKTKPFTDRTDQDYYNLGNTLKKSGLGENQLNESKKPIFFGLL